MIIGDGNDPVTGFDYVDQWVNGVVERRLLTALPTPRDHAMMALPGWEAATGIEPIPRSEWPKHLFNNKRISVPILDQNGHGACVGYASTSIAMVLCDRMGFTYEPLSADFLYTLINGGVDAGANGGDAIQAMIETGIAPARLVPGRPIRPAGYSKDAVAAAAAYRLRPDGAIPLTSFDEVVTAVIERWQILFDVQASGAYNTGPDGTVRYCGRYTNHEQSAGEGLRIVNGQAQVLGRNSWNTAWGQNGFGWFTESHFEASNSTFAVKFMAANPNDPRNPAVFV